MDTRIDTSAPARTPVNVEVDLESENNFYSGVTSDISEGGLFVATYVPPRIGEVLELHLTLPGEAEGFEVSGVVRWVRDVSAACDGAPPGFGMHWIMLSAEGVAAIQRFAKRRDTLLYEAA